MKDFYNLQRYMSVLLIGSLVSILQGCNDAPAPSPIPNPHPTQSLKVKITVEKSYVNRIDVNSIWVVGNLGCAPTIWPAGNSRVQQVEVPEKVQKIAAVYVATVMTDRFLRDQCHWLNGGLEIRFFHDDYLLATYGMNADALYELKTLKVTCLTRPFVNAGACSFRDEELFYKSEDKNAFNVSMEPEK